MDTKMYKECPNPPFPSKVLLSQPSIKTSFISIYMVWCSYWKPCYARECSFCNDSNLMTDQGRGKKAQPSPELRDNSSGSYMLHNSIWWWLKLCWFFFAIWLLPMTNTLSFHLSFLQFLTPNKYPSHKSPPQCLVCFWRKQPSFVLW